MSTRPTTSTMAATRPRAGLVLGTRYELTDRIAVGGMGEVWRALDRRLGRTVAVKVLRPELSGDELFLNRLRTEARNTAGLQHPNLAVLLDHGESAGSGYLVMELVDGETLAARLTRAGRLGPAAAVAILVQACRGLHAAHTAGVVHRDVKPANVMVTADGAVKLTDFGISLGANQAPMTSTGMVMGTAHYLAPEQATGKPATPAGDVYALGVLAFECLAGERPFAGATQLEVASAHIRQPVPPLPDSVPAALARVVHRMLAKDPGERPASALVCARELEEAAREIPGHDGGSAAPVPEPPADAAPVLARLPLPEEAEPGHPSAAPRPASPPAMPPVRAASPRSPSRAARDGAPRRRQHLARPRSRWRMPTWRELAANRLWLATMTVVALTLVVLIALIATGIGTLGSADSSGQTPPSTLFPSTVRTTISG